MLEEPGAVIEPGPSACVGEVLNKKRAEEVSNRADRGNGRSSKEAVAKREVLKI
jgi:hypothetical protein